MFADGANSETFRSEIKSLKGKSPTHRLKSRFLIGYDMTKFIFYRIPLTNNDIRCLLLLSQLNYVWSQRSKSSNLDSNSLLPGFLDKDLISLRVLSDIDEQEVNKNGF